MRGLLDKGAVIWRKEAGFSLLLVFLLAALFVAPFLGQRFPGLASVNLALFILLLVTGVLVVSDSLVAVLGASLLAGAAISLEVVQKLSGSDPFPLWRLGAEILTLGLFTVVTLLRVFSPGEVTTHRLVGAVAAYLLVGLTWSYAYEFVYTALPDSFHIDASQADDAYPPLLYFSFVTLSTVGYGDITPLSSAARALSNLESLVGVLYPAVLIGRLLSLHGPGAGTPSPPPPAAP